jgi:hypothetical protein
VTLRRDPIPSPNYSTRGSTQVTHIVLHTAEGALTYESLGNYFANPDAEVSSHTGIDDTPGVIGEYVHRDGKAWTASNANPWSVQAELCGFAEWDIDEWMRHPVMLENAAYWVAEEAAAYGIPIDDIAATATNPSERGVCQHFDLGSAGGGHWDCGLSFPIDHVLDIARTGTPAPQPEPEPEDDDVANWTICAAYNDATQWVTDMVSVKRRIANEDDWNSTVWCLVASGAKVYYQDVGNPIQVPSVTLDAIPEVQP